MTLTQLLNTRYGVIIALAIAKGTPPWLGYRIGNWIAAFFGRRRRADLMKNLCLNQWVISGKKKNAYELDHAARTVLRSVARNYYDFYHNMDRPEEVLRLVKIPPEFEEALQKRIDSGQGTMIVMPHIGNFDLAGRALALRGYKFQVLTHPDAVGGYVLQNRLRTERGLEATPMNLESLQRAKHRLLDGGFVLTGMDRPMVNSNYPVTFFGHKALLPVTYIRMAMQTGVPVMVVACYRDTDGRYNLEAHEPIPMLTEGKLSDLIVCNAERVLAHAEQLIQRFPGQWAMFYPVWPQLWDEMPKWWERRKAVTTATG